MNKNDDQRPSSRRNVLITGCSSGIGRELAKAYHQRGYKVWATARDSEKLNELKERGMQCLELDILDELQMHAVIARITEEDQKLDILINNAGYGGMGPLVDTSREELERQFATNVFAPMTLVRAVTPIMKEQGNGMIVNIGSVSGVFVTPFSGSYCASKAAFNALSDALRMELKPFGIKVVTVQPGAVRSRFADNASITLGRIWKPDSLYKPIEHAVFKRARASLDNPTEVEDFCRSLVNQLESSRPLNIVRLANGGKALPILKACVPTRWLEWMLGKLFSLDKL
ncbi:short-chain dehydrogenase [Endozoicomonas sp. (ex Bugula neritina AB1)]|nr:short-chain dehydrogenase [Endozoicomonas sp. (ex Bugula neritina AB1)]